MKDKHLRRHIVHTILAVFLTVSIVTAALLVYTGSYEWSYKYFKHFKNIKASATREI